MIARARQHNDNRRAGRHGINKTERAMVERLARPAVEPVDLAGMLTDAGVDRLAMCPDWGEVPQPVLPADVVAAANAGEPEPQYYHVVQHGMIVATAYYDACEAALMCRDTRVMLVHVVRGAWQTFPIASAATGRMWRKPHAGEVHRLHVAWHRRCNEERMSDG